MAEPGTIVVLENAQNEAIVRRSGSGVIQQWDRIPKRVQGDILRDAKVGLETGRRRPLTASKSRLSFISTVETADSAPGP